MKRGPSRRPNFAEHLFHALGWIRAKRKEEPGLLGPGSCQCALLVLSWRRLASGVLVLHRQGLALALTLRLLTAWVLADRRNLGERHSAKGHRQRQHQRRDQQRNALLHLLTSFPFCQSENQPTPKSVRQPVALLALPVPLKRPS